MPQYDLPEHELRTYRTRAVAPDDLQTFWTTTLAESRALVVGAEGRAGRHRR